MVSEAEEITHEDRCEDALDLYEDMVKRTSMGTSLIPRAIEFYKERWVSVAERKMIFDFEEVLEALEEGWIFDPWLSSRGTPTVIGAVDDKVEYYWFMVKGSPEQVARIAPFIELPVDEEEEPEPVKQPYGLLTEYIPYDKEGKPSREPQAGYVIMHKDHVYAKGTVYTKAPGMEPTAWDVAKALAELSSHLGVDEAHDVIQGILNKEFVPT